jgi:FlaA1/EpsC-like NDP-sugar epimerase
MFEKSLAKKALKLPRTIKIILAIFLDGSFCLLSTFMAFILTFNIFVFNLDLFILNLIGAIISISTFYFYGLYKTIFRYSGVYNYEILIKAFLTYFVLYTVTLLAFMPKMNAISMSFSQPMIMLIFVSISRLLINFYFGLYKVNQINKRGVIIYGTGPSARELASNLKFNNRFYLSCFIDENKDFWGGTIDGYQVFPPSEIEKIIYKNNVQKLWLALPNSKNTKRHEIINNLRKLPIHVQTLPRYFDLINNNVFLNDLRELDIDELLGRDAVKPNGILLKKCIKDKCVLITGAGGSIGSELCYQTLQQSPNKIILVDNSEIALYEILNKLELIKSKNIRFDKTLIIPLLDDVVNKNSVEHILKTWKPNTIYHSAAYKQVPLVENNMVVGIRNNIVGTLNCAELAVKYKVKHFVLISSDKAVRPTNIMGASKRLSEIIVQAISNEQLKTNTLFSMVRFGNVIGSSGSVVPLFRKQIESGGPITLTDKNITRYFMSIKEAAQLVIQAGAMSSGGEVFVLDMGKPIRIADLAVNMVNASGLNIKNEKNPLGDIEIKLIGLRPGEKLYEELLIGKNTSPTKNPKILKAYEIFPSKKEFNMLIQKLINAIEKRNKELIVKLLIKYVNGYVPSKRMN